MPASASAWPSRADVPDPATPPDPAAAPPDQSDLDAIWHEFARLDVHGRLARRPDFRFDPDFYASRNPDVAGEKDPAARARHFAEVGAAEGRHPTLYAESVHEAPGATGRGSTGRSSIWCATRA